MLAVLPMAGATGCGTSTANDDVSANDKGSQQLVTAETIAGLKAGEQFVVDLRKEGVAYTFDFSKAPIDFSRIAMVNADGKRLLMSEWLSAAKANGDDLLAKPDQKFRLASAASSLGTLTESERAQLEATGKLTKRPVISAQATEYYCYIVIEIYQFCALAEDGTLVCLTVIIESEECIEIEVEEEEP
ncbi:hypothetical protein A176_000148 [Myxococcus hansupus]|uniref:Uncharacterized protein n=2 Tax=Pseudomyxococcus hansupus TaxID=1297742 RepID=A0A0H4WIU0_9BACT|nr:hypothetical protein A176_000148 [Myxococcus hansupus]